MLVILYLFPPGNISLPFLYQLIVGWGLARTHALILVVIPSGTTLDLRRSWNSGA